MKYPNYHLLTLQALQESESSQIADLTQLKTKLSQDHPNRNILDYLDFICKKQNVLSSAQASEYIQNQGVINRKHDRDHKKQLQLVEMLHKLNKLNNHFSTRGLAFNQQDLRNNEVQPLTNQALNELFDSVNDAAFYFALEKSNHEKKDV